jgi:hypothetical protein
MPKFYEIFGFKASEINDELFLAVKCAMCPFTGSLCDGGGNRHQTKITLLPDHDLRMHFADTLVSIVPAVCSIDYGEDQWVVCPRRLMGFKNDTQALPPLNYFLQDHEKDVLIQAGLKTDIEYGVWSEIYLQYKIDDTEIDYHFDFVIAPILKQIRLQDLVESYGATREDIRELEKSAKTGKLLDGAINNRIISAAPDLTAPIIIEVMTASTSGSNTAAGTNISSAFKNLLMGLDYQGPGINKRQVWGRMATQLFAKSALAEFWGGKTFWLVQDQLLKNIELTTKLNTSVVQENSEETINFISMKYQDIVLEKRPSVEVDKVAILKSGISFNGNNNCSDILLPKFIPPKLWLLKCMLRRNVSALIKL